MPIVLHLRPGAREWFLRWLGEAHPALVPRYAELYGRGAYARKDYQARINAQVRELAERFGVGRSRPAAARGGAQARSGPQAQGAGRGLPRPAGAPRTAAVTSRSPVTARPADGEHEQLTLL
jgi:hypothetical protein